MRFHRLILWLLICLSMTNCRAIEGLGQDIDSVFSCDNPCSASKDGGEDGGGDADNSEPSDSWFDSNNVQAPKTEYRDNVPQLSVPSVAMTAPTPVKSMSVHPMPVTPDKQKISQAMGRTQAHQLPSAPRDIPVNHPIKLNQTPQKQCHYQKLKEAKTISHLYAVFYKNPKTCTAFDYRIYTTKTYQILIDGRGQQDSRLLDADGAFLDFALDIAQTARPAVKAWGKKQIATQGCGLLSQTSCERLYKL